ncbi:hypothetical protein [Chishuiella sp.]|uniref:hypothetical protein n=1 Tax=Chishuiella sp. TaxID=1969467 RepID=UPI0028A62C82|nr:hypothetical protein [Chishuiella sp.]
MKNNLYLLFMLITTLSFGQNIKRSIIPYKKTITPTLINLNQPVDMSIQHVSNSDYINEIINNNSLKYNFPTYMTNNSSNPKYIAIVNYIYNEPYTFYKKDNLGITNTIIIKSNIDAIVYMIEPGKGVFDTDTIHFTNNKNNDILRNSAEISSTISKSIMDKDIAPYFINGVFPHPGKVKEVNTSQILDIADASINRIKNKITTYTEDKRISINTLKEDKNFKSEVFDNAIKIVNNNTNPIDKEKIIEAINLFDSEYEKNKNDNDKKINKYKVAIIGNILTLNYLIDKYDTTEKYKSIINSLQRNNSSINWYLSEEKKYNTRLASSRLNKQLEYTTIPENIIEMSLHKNNLTNTPEDYENTKINTVSYSSTEVIYFRNELFRPLFQLNNFIYFLQELDPEIVFASQNLNLTEPIILYINNTHGNLKRLKSSTKDKMQDYITFCTNLNKTYDSKNKSVWGEDRETMINKKRNYISENYKTTDIKKYIPNLQIAVNQIMVKNPEKQEVYNAILNLNSIIQVRYILSDSNYKEKERKEYENIVDEFLEKQFINRPNKNDIYFEFKKTIDLFEKTKGKKNIEEQDAKNYETLLINIASYYI